MYLKCKMQPELYPFLQTLQQKLDTETNEQEIITNFHRYSPMSRFLSNWENQIWEPDVLEIITNLQTIRKQMNIRFSNQQGFDSQAFHHALQTVLKQGYVDPFESWVYSQKTKKAA
jgi:hypothetical protein